MNTRSNLSEKNFFRAGAFTFFAFATSLMFSCSSSDDEFSGRGTEKIIFKVSHNGSDQHPIQTGFEVIGKILEEESDGAVEFQIFPASQIASEEDAIEMVKLGVIAATAASAGGLGSFVPEADLFNFPFIFRDLDHFYRVLDGPVGQRVSRAIEDELNCLVLGWWFSGIRNTWNSEKPIHTPNDLNGMKIRVIGSPIVLDTFNAFGAQATNMSWGELYSAIQQGVLDGAECDYADLLVEKFYEITKYVSTTEHLFLAVALIVSKKQYDKLPPHIQTLLHKACQSSIVIQRRAMEETNDLALAELKKKGLIFNDVDKSPFQQIAQEVYRRNAQKVGGLKVLEQIISQK